MLNKSSIQFSVDGWGCVLSLLFYLRTNYGGGNEDNGNLLQKSLAAALSAPDPEERHLQPTPLLETTGHSHASLVQSRLGSLLLYLFWCAQCFLCALKESVFQVL